MIIKKKARASLLPWSDKRLINPIRRENRVRFKNVDWCGFLLLEEKSYCDDILSK